MVVELRIGNEPMDVGTLKQHGVPMLFLLPEHRCGPTDTLRFGLGSTESFPTDFGKQKSPDLAAGAFELFSDR